MAGGDFSLNIVGERYDNADGSSRQDEIERVQPGEPVDLIREPNNKHDPSAIGVWSARGVQIGYIAADRTGWIGGKLDGDVRAIVERKTGQHGRRGLVLLINLQGSDPDLEAAQARWAAYQARRSVEDFSAFSGPDWGA